MLVCVKVMVHFLISKVVTVSGWLAAGGFFHAGWPGSAVLAPYINAVIHA